MPEPKIYLPSKSVDLEFMSGLELVDSNIYPLPGGVINRGSGDPDPRMTIEHPQSTDTLTFYEHLATVRHKDRYFVCFRQTLDALYKDQQDLVRFPKYVMQSGVKKTELKIFIWEVKANPKKMARNMDSGTTWFDQWLKEIEHEPAHDTLVYFLIHKSIVEPEMFR